jgi:putative salt-induced outer membrane protein
VRAPLVAQETEIKGMRDPQAGKHFAWAVAGALVLCGVAHADDATDGDGTWASRAQAGYSKTGGNTDTASGTALFHIAHTWDQWKFLFGAEGFYGSTAGVTTAQSWDSYLQANYNISDRLYWFGKLSVTSNKFSGFVYQDVVSTGVGYSFIKTDATKFDGQIGIGERWIKTAQFQTDALGAIIADSYFTSAAERDTVVDASLRLDHSFNSLTKIIAAYEINSGSNNTMQTGSVSLQVKMSDRLGLALGYQLTTNSSPPPGIGKSSSLESVTLTYTLQNKNLAPE